MDEFCRVVESSEPEEDFMFSLKPQIVAGERAVLYFYFVVVSSFLRMRLRHLRSTFASAIRENRIKETCLFGRNRGWQESVQSVVQFYRGASR